jgi:hypothetical protein
MRLKIVLMWNMGAYGDDQTPFLEGLFSWVETLCRFCANLNTQREPIYCTYTYRNNPPFTPPTIYISTYVELDILVPHF